MDSKSQTFWKGFIELYRNQNCLWNIKSSGYTNQIIRGKSYKVLLNKLKEINSFATLDYLKKKINNIRTSFRREYKKVQHSKRGATNDDQIYQPTLWYYDLLLFTVRDENGRAIALYDHDSDREMDPDNLSMDVHEDGHCEDHLLPPDSNALVKIKDENVDSPEMSTYTCQSFDSPIGRKRKSMAYETMQENDQSQDSLHDDTLRQDDDESGVTEKKTVFQLKALDEYQRIIAEKQEDVLLAPVNKSKEIITIKEENIHFPEKSIYQSCPVFDSPVEGNTNGWANDAIKNEDQSLDLLQNDTLAAIDEEYMVIGRRIAFQLNALDGYQKIIAEKLISDIIFYGKLGKLTESASIHCS